MLDVVCVGGEEKTGVSIRNALKRELIRAYPMQKAI
jgi:hypothetical protein